MSLEEAIDVLNARHHAGVWSWQVADIGGVRGATDGESCVLTEFEAVAVAQRYLREST